MDNNTTISTLNNLIETCKDGQNGFQTAAEGIERADIKSVFYEYSKQRAQFAGELQSLVTEMGGDPEESGSLAASVHRGFINIKSVVTGKDETAILEECERGEDIAVKAYKDAMEANLSGAASELVSRQYQSVKEAHDRVRDLRNANRAANA